MSEVNYTRVTITFEIEKLLNQIQLRSIYSSRNNEGVLSITDAEKDLANINLRTAATEVYNALQSLTRYNVPFDYDYNEGGKRKILYELLLSSDWDSYLKIGLTDAIEQMLVNYTLKDWYGTTDNKAFQYAQVKYDEAYNRLKSNINSRKNPTRRPYTVI